MNVNRFTARTSREALALVRQAFGEDAVVLSTKPCEGGVEVLAMAPEGLREIEQAAATAPRVAATAAPASPAAAPPAAPAATPPRARGAGERVEPRLDSSVERDVEKLSMSTLSFQDYVRERMLKRRQAALEAAAAAPAPPPPADAREPMRLVARRERDTAASAASPGTPLPQLADALQARTEPIAAAAMPTRSERITAAALPTRTEQAATAVPLRREPPVMREERRAVAPPTLLDAAPARREQAEMLDELRSMRGLIEQRFGALAFMEKLQRQPRQATLTQRLLDHGFSPSLIRKLVDSLPADIDPLGWAAGVLERNLATGEHEPALEDVGGVYALIGSTGVGKTTSTAKLAAAFATRHGAAHLGLVTLDAYRVGAHEQLRAYGRILGVPVHTAHDRASLEDLLELLSAKKMVLIDTAGMAQRDSRTRELLDMLSHRAVNRLLVVNASAQGETIEDVLLAYDGAACRGIVLSKIDEAVKLGPALDALIRHKLKLLAVGNGQRVPEDWHRLSAASLVQQSLRATGGAAWRLDAGDVSLVFAGLPGRPATAVLPA